MKRILPYLVALAAFTLAGAAAYYSIFGLSKFYAGAATAVIIMGIAIESSKVIATSVLHQYHKVLSWPVKIYLTLAIILSMIITSVGIYGFLTSAYQETATKVELLDGEVGVVENKKKSFEDNIKRLQSQIDSKNSRVTTLSTVRSQQESRLQTLYDAKYNAAARRTETLIKDADKQINVLTIEIDSLNANITSLNDSISNLDKSILQKNADSDVASEVGPLRFISNLTGSSMDSIVNWFTILLILIFDPLAVALIIVLNGILKKNDDTEPIVKYKTNHIEKEPEVEKELQPEISEDITEESKAERVGAPTPSSDPGDIYEEKTETPKRRGKPFYW